MADQEHLDILSQGVKAWNTWRVQHPEVQNPDLTGANLEGADLGEADLTQAVLGRTIFGDVDLSGVKGLDTVRHYGPSTIGIDTIYRSQSQIPEVFLRGAGVPDIFIDYMHSLVTTGIEYYSCFISYSSQDHAFAERLHADLQNHNVRCWFAPHDMRIGEPIVRGIDQSIRLHDKLLLILSEASLSSNWVEYEVQLALTREQTEQRTVLFPVRLDDAVLHTQHWWPARIMTRHIGDFTHWKNHDDYQQVFQRLLRDLKAQNQASTG